jgi:hypothetical protein
MHLRFSTVLAALAVFVLASACGGSDVNPGGPSVGSATVSGTVGGAAFLATSSTAMSAVVSDSKGGASFIVITSDLGLCAQLGSAYKGKSQQRLEIVLYTMDSNKVSHAATSTGDYSLNMSSPTGLYAEVDFYTEDASCQQVLAQTGGFGTGTVHLASIQGDVFAGTFDVTTGSNHLTGSFSPVACAAMQKMWDGSTLTCQ